MKRIIVGISGADGVCLGSHLLKTLYAMPDVETHLVMTSSAERNFLLEGTETPDEVKRLADVCHNPDNMAASIASGSFRTDGMIIAPCSMKTLAHIVSGCADNLLLRAADVCLKEGRKVVLIPREMPLSRIHLRNLLSASEAGCHIVPPVLTFYNHPATVEDHINHIIGKSLMLLGIEPPFFRAWQGEEA